MKEKLLSVLIVVLLLTIVFSGCNEQTNSGNENDDSNNGYHEPVTLYVDDGGSVQYKDIQDAIDNASDGDTVFVYSGVYNGEITVAKSISLVGEDKNNTIIDGTLIGGAHYSGGDVGLTITSDRVSVSGFNIQNGENDVTSVAIQIRGAQNVTIFNNIINKTDEGIVIQIEMNNAVIEVSDKRSRNNIIRDNEIMSEGSYCIHIDGYSHYNTIQNNIIKKGSNSLYIESSGNNIFDNTIIYGGTGIKITSKAENNVIYRNDISNCNQNGLYVSGDNNFIYLNNIYDNSKDINYEGNVHSTGENTWYNESTMEGNYYGDFYTGLDEDKDGIGDTLYNIPGGNDQDNYPLMNPVDI